MTPIAAMAASLTPLTDVSWIRAVPPAAPSDPGLPVGAIAAAAVTATVVAWVVTWLLRRDRAAGGPVVRTLAAGLGVAFADRRLLTRVARCAGFTSAAPLLVSRGCYEEAARRWGGDAARLDAIRRHVFR